MQIIIETGFILAHDEKTLAEGGQNLEVEVEVTRPTQTPPDFSMTMNMEVKRNMNA